MDAPKPWVLVTGGSRGIGSAIVRKLCEASYMVVFTYKSSQTYAKELELELNSEKMKCIGRQCDMTNQEHVGLMADELLYEYGAPSALICNAGITMDSLIINMPSENWSQVINTNLDATYYVIRAFASSMVENGNGSIVLVSSVTANKGNVGQSNYGASKAALVGMSKSLAVELGRFNVRVNVVAPGYISSDMTSALSDSVKKKALSMIPMSRIGSVDDVAAAVEFLLGSGADYITGQTLVVDGGLTA